MVSGCLYCITLDLGGMQNWGQSQQATIFERLTQREKKALRFGPPKNPEDLDIMFDKSKVSGLSACISGEEVHNSPINLLDEDDNEEEGFEDTTKTKRIVVKGLKRKRKTPSPRKKVKNPMVRVMTKMVDDVISTKSITSQAMQGDFTGNDIAQVMKLAKEAGAVEGSDEHFMATKFFIKSENGDVFLTFETNEGRFNWLKRCYEERKK